MTTLEQAAQDALELCERIIAGRRIWDLNDMREVSTALRAALEQADPVDKSLTKSRPAVDKEQAERVVDRMNINEGKTK